MRKIKVNGSRGLRKSDGFSQLVARTVFIAHLPVNLVGDGSLWDNYRAAGAVGGEGDCWQSVK